MVPSLEKRHILPEQSSSLLGVTAIRGLVMVHFKSIVDVEQWSVHGGVEAFKGSFSRKSSIHKQPECCPQATKVFEVRVSKPPSLSSTLRARKKISLMISHFEVKFLYNITK